MTVRSPWLLIMALALVAACGVDDAATQTRSTATDSPAARAPAATEEGDRQALDEALAAGADPSMRG